MNENKIVVRLKDKTLMKGTTSDVVMKERYFNMKLLSGDVIPVDVKKVKAVFYVKTFDGNRNYKCLYKDIIPWGGEKVKIKFFDGEEMIGYSPNHLKGRFGFFVTPADLLCNNKKVFVATSSTEEIKFI